MGDPDNQSNISRRGRRRRGGRNRFVRGRKMNDGRFKAQSPRIWRGPYRNNNDSQPYDISAESGSLRGGVLSRLGSTRSRYMRKSEMRFSSNALRDICRSNLVTDITPSRGNVHSRLGPKPNHDESRSVYSRLGARPDNEACRAFEGDVANNGRKNVLSRLGPMPMPTQIPAPTQFSTDGWRKADIRERLGPRQGSVHSRLGPLIANNVDDDEWSALTAAAATEDVVLNNRHASSANMRIQSHEREADAVAFVQRKPTPSASNSNQLLMLDNQADNQDRCSLDDARHIIRNKTRQVADARTIIQRKQSLAAANEKILAVNQAMGAHFESNVAAANQLLNEMGSGGDMVAAQPDNEIRNFYKQLLNRIGLPDSEDDREGRYEGLVVHSRCDNVVDNVVDEGEGARLPERRRVEYRDLPVAFPDDAASGNDVEELINAAAVIGKFVNPTAAGLVADILPRRTIVNNLYQGFAKVRKPGEDPLLHVTKNITNEPKGILRVLKTKEENPVAQPQTKASPSKKAFPNSVLRNAPDSAYRNAPDSAYRNAPDSLFRNAPDGAFRNVPDSAFRNAPDTTFRNAPENVFLNAPENALWNAPDNAYRNAPNNAYGNAPDNAFRNAPENAFATENRKRPATVNLNSQKKLTSEIVQEIIERTARQNNAANVAATQVSNRNFGNRTVAITNPVADSVPVANTACSPPIQSMNFESDMEGGIDLEVGGCSYYVTKRSVILTPDVDVVQPLQADSAAVCSSFANATAANVDVLSSFDEGSADDFAGRVLTKKMKMFNQNEGNNFMNALPASLGESSFLRSQGNISEVATRMDSPGYLIYVSNLRESVTSRDIKELFEDVGRLKYARITRPGFAEVVYWNKCDAKTAIATYHGRPLDSQRMSLSRLPPVTNVG